MRRIAKLREEIERINPYKDYMIRDWLSMRSLLNYEISILSRLTRKRKES